MSNRQNVSETGAGHAGGHQARHADQAAHHQAAHHQAGYTDPAEQIAIILYTVRNECGTEKDFRNTIRRLYDIGYRSVQVSGVGHLDARMIRETLDELGMTCCGTHDELDRYLNRPEEVIAFNRALGSSYSALSYPGDEYWTGGSGPKLARELNEVGRRLSKEGIQLGYHNHQFEFSRYGGSRTLMDVLVDTTDPELVQFEIDVHWVVRGGADPVALIDRLSRRCSRVHFKDLAIEDGEPVFAEIGQGNLNWPAILRACRAAGTHTYIVEQDEPRPGRSIFESAALSYDFMRQLGIGSELVGDDP